MKNGLVTVLHRSVVRSASDSSHRNRRLSFKSDIQESLKLLDTKPSFVWKDSHHKYKSRNTNNDVSNKTRSKVDYTDQHIGSRTWPKMHNINVSNLSIQNLFFPLNDATLFQGHGKSQAQDLQLGVLECKVYHRVLMNTKSQVYFDCLLQLHMLYNTEEDKYMSWEFHKVVDYCKEKGDVNSSSHKCLLEWNDINKNKSWVNYFALSLSNLKPIISFSRNNNLLDKMPFYHLTQYCRSNTAVDIARILKASTSPAGIKYKFGIQVPKGIKNATDLDKKNGNQLWQNAIKTELKQLTDHQTFIVLDSEEDIPTGYQKIPYHMVFDVKYDLIHKARLVAGGNWTVNDKEDIYSGVCKDG
jgi:hypothetical protein